MIKVIIADDHQIVVDGLVSLLKNEPDIEVAKTFLNGKNVLEYLMSNKIDIAIIDINMPEMNGLETTLAIQEADLVTKVLVLSMYDDYEHIGELLEAGCSGYILKNKGQEELCNAIRKIYCGDEFYGAKVLETIIKAQKTPKTFSTTLPVSLTKREIEVIKLISQEFTSPEISKKLNIAQTTVDTHRRNLIAKLNVKNSLGLVRYAMKSGLGD